MLGVQIIKIITIMIIVIITKGAGDADGPQEKAVESSWGEKVTILLNVYSNPQELFFIIENIFIVVMIFITKTFYHHLNTWMLQQTAGRKGLLHHGDISTQCQLTRFPDVTKLTSLQITLSPSSSDPNV